MTFFCRVVRSEAAERVEDKGVGEDGKVRLIDGRTGERSTDRLQLV